MNLLVPLEGISRSAVGYNGRMILAHGLKVVPEKKYPILVWPTNGVDG
jgi:hypothetical protein